MKRIICTLTLILLIASCKDKKHSNKEIVEHQGVLREIMMENKLDSNFDLAKLKKEENVYALGALERLSGEFVVFNSEITKSFVHQDKMVTNDQLDGGATLIVKSTVEEWILIELDHSITSIGDFQLIMELLADKNKISGPFPFLLEGRFDSVNWHIINAPEAENKSHDAYKKSGLVEQSFDQALSMLGFFSKDHEGVFTHHGSYLHIHVKNDDLSIAGHVDDMSISSKMILKLPKELIYEKD